MTELLSPDALWAGLLSGRQDLIRSAWETLGDAERTVVRRHLRTMASGEGWQEGQRRAARAALEWLDEHAPET